mmetsp:Transcript_12243/g.35880  ORF Transcript_12243/g.35880 Transcript_12243/m.35880 type:complete len:247 (+) Transcript_12243:2506-3246(+)
MLFEMEPRYATRGLPHLAGTACDAREEAERVPALPENVGSLRGVLCFHGLPAMGENHQRRRAGRSYIKKVPRAPREPGRGSRLRGLVARRVCVEAARGAPRAGLVIVVARRRDRCYHKVAPVREPADAPDAAGGDAARCFTFSSKRSRGPPLHSSFGSEAPRAERVVVSNRQARLRGAAPPHHRHPRGGRADADRLRDVALSQSCNGEAGLLPESRRACDQARSRAVDEAAASASLRGARAPRRDG